MVYSEPKILMDTCKRSNCPWYIVGAKLNDRIGFILLKYNKKWECKLTKKPMKVSSAWVVTKVKS